MLTPKCSALMARPAAAAASSITTLPAAASSGVHRAGNHPSDRRPHRTSAPGAMPPSHISRGCCTGTGDTVTSAKLAASPSWVTVSPAHRRRSRGMTSSMTAERRLEATPMACFSGPTVSPGTNVTSRRPPDSTSRVASSLASRTGLRPGSSMVVPSLIFWLRPAAHDSPTSGSITGAVSTSDSHSESNPSPSRSSTRRTICGSVSCEPLMPTPMRTFMDAPYGAAVSCARAS